MVKLEKRVKSARIGPNRLKFALFLNYGLAFRAGQLFFIG